MDKNAHDDSLVNPICGVIGDYPPTTIFVGGEEIMYPDIIKYKKLCEEENVDLQIVKQMNMGHCYPLFPVVESKSAFNLVVKTINDNVKKTS